jgi:hypothetical protein
LPELKMPAGPKTLKDEIEAADKPGAGSPPAVEMPKSVKDLPPEFPTGAPRPEGGSAPPPVPPEAAKPPESAPATPAAPAPGNEAPPK